MVADGVEEPSGEGKRCAGVGCGRQDEMKRKRG